MNEKTVPYHVVDLTPGRRVWLNTLDLLWSPHCIYGLLEVAVTLARAIDEDKAVQSYRKGRQQLIMFDDVNVGVMIEGRADDKRALTGYVIRKANRKTFREIHEEIRSVQSTPVPANSGMPTWYRSLAPYRDSRTGGRNDGSGGHRAQ